MGFPIKGVEEKYEILHKLGEGGMGAVYQVRHRLLGELRVVKVVHAVHAGNLKAHRRFEREAKAATALRHPNIAQIYDFVAEEDGAYLVMELIDGLTFKELLSRCGQLPLPLVLELSLQSLDALDYLHGQGFVHRDIAPDNLMLSRRPQGTPWVKLIDLGLAKGPTETLDLTGSNTFVGKVRYASPEVFRQSVAGPSTGSDLYSFGVVLYEMLTGVCPIVGSSFEELMAAHLLRPPLSFESSDPQARVPPEIRRLVMALLSKNPGQRPDSAQALRGLLAAQHTTSVSGFEALWGRCRSGLSSPTEGVTVTSPRGAEATAEASRTVLAANEVGSPEVEPPEAGPRTAGPRTAGPRPTEVGTNPVSLLRRGRSWAWTAAAALALVLALALPWSEGSRSTDPRRSPQGDPPAASSLTVPSPAASSSVGSSPGLAQGVGRLRVEAAPWAEILSINDADGRPIALSGPVYTPTELVLAEGGYSLLLAHPEMSEPRAVTVQVPIAGTVEVVEQMVEDDIEAYFRRQGLADELERAGS